MADVITKDIIIKERLEHSGLFNFSELYRYMHDWLKDNLYGVNEDKYSEKVSGAARDISFEWKVSKKMSDYFKIEHSIRADVTGLTEVEVEIEGKRKSMNKGKIGIDIKGVLIKDYEGAWGGPFYRFLRGIYDKYIIPKEVKAMEDKIESDVRAFKDEVKAYLELTGKR